MSLPEMQHVHILKMLSNHYELPYKSTDQSSSLGEAAFQAYNVLKLYLGDA